MSHSLIRRLARMHTAISIDVFSPHALTHLFEQMPEIDEIIENPFGHGQLNMRDRLNVARDIKSRRYDIAYVLPNSLKSTRMQTRSLEYKQKIDEFLSSVVGLAAGVYTGISMYVFFLC